MRNKVQQRQKLSKSVQIRKFFERARERFCAFVRVVEAQLYSKDFILRTLMCNSSLKHNIRNLSQVSNRYSVERHNVAIK